MFIMALPNNLILVHQITPLRCAHVATVLCHPILYTAFSNKHCTIKHTPNFTSKMTYFRFNIQNT